MSLLDWEQPHFRTRQFKSFRPLAAPGQHFQRSPITGWPDWRMPRDLEFETFKFSFWSPQDWVHLSSWFHLGSWFHLSSRFHLTKGEGWSSWLGVGGPFSTSNSWSSSRLEHAGSSTLDRVDFAILFLVLCLVFGSCLPFLLSFQFVHLRWSFSRRCSFPARGLPVVILQLKVPRTWSPIWSL